MPEAPTLFDYTLRTADNCEGRFHYELMASGVLNEAPSERAWTPRKPYAETIEAILEIQRGTGGSAETLVLTGDQHRDLEDRGVFADLLREIASGAAPEEVLTRLSEFPGPALCLGGMSA